MELPQISSYTGSSSTYVPDSNINLIQTIGVSNPLATPISRSDTPTFRGGGLESSVLRKLELLQAEEANEGKPDYFGLHRYPEIKEVKVMAKRRLVQVYIVDPDENVPHDKALIYEGNKQLTDLDNNELFYEIPISSLLKEHNEYRKTVVDKNVKERTQHLEPTRISKLKMVVVEIATF